MRKVLILSLTGLFLLLLSSSVFAAGWHTIGGTNNPDGGQWLNTETPHEGLQSSTNACKACHAVHDSNGASFKLLQNDNRADECNACHKGTTAYTSAKPYDIVTNPRGEHSLDGYTMNDPSNSAAIPNEGLKTIPEASASVIAANSIKDDGLSCGNCHSVHDAYTIDGDDTAPDNVIPIGWATKILRRDPANNGQDALTGISSVVDADDSGFMADPAGSTTADEVQAAYCGDCHNKNPNWSTGNTATNEGTRPNPAAHALGGVDGKIDVYGTVRNVLTTAGAAQYLSGTCDSCHKRVTGNTPVGLNDQFPHQSRSEKFLGTYDVTEAKVVEYRNGTGSDVGDPKRILANLDTKVCKECHGEVGKPGDSASF